MTGIYVFSEDPRLAAELVTSAAALADEVHAVCLGADAAGTLSATGATSVVVLEARGTTGAARPEAYVAALAGLVRDRGADLLLVGATVSGWEVAARVAALLDCALVSEASVITALPDGAWQAERVMYAGGAVQTETWTGTAVVTVAAGRAVAASASGSASPVEVVAVDVDERVRVLSRTARVRAGVDLASAARVVCIGMGLAEPGDLELAGDLAEALDAEVACTRPVAEDRGLLPTERYIGISGAHVHPDLYVGLGVSGQVQHTVGFRDAKVVVGINTSPTAPLFAVCDYAVVGDAHEIVPLLAAAVRARR
ncbi:electron transfer flavoprotein subunit alpha [Cellulomonas sp. WB94]|uniref:electron transfer flavoprotein subunit alpha/FixB family protein n=1 Tax=Cellulomonas sp. WB94 TaxID=2173174 RepID=UPI000D569256|nr:electron transfer flavoprotein subunit alpha/FixB family protein [Cellulomonas sp. WB94]PVU82736.1 electron transfer flavoprotein subunit alpha [Cellulomonas sp. WB94]